MPKLSPEMIAAGLIVAERVLLFCVASDTDWSQAGVTGSIAQHMIGRRLIERDHLATRFVLTDQGRAVLAALLGRAEV
jgi:hypothetical protein